jgi:hypothetical protein
MIPELLKKRLRKDRPMMSVSIRMPEDMVESMKEIAPQKGLTGYQALVKTYISEGLRRDEAHYVFNVKSRVEDAMKRRGLPNEVIEAVVNEAALV